MTTIYHIFVLAAFYDFSSFPEAKVTEICFINIFISLYSILIMILSEMRKVMLSKTNLNNSPLSHVCISMSTICDFYGFTCKRNISSVCNANIMPILLSKIRPDCLCKDKLETIHQRKIK